MTSCGNRSNDNQDSISHEKSASLPTITESGVEPFVLGQSILNIPHKGQFYDTITHNKFYGVVMGDHYLEIEESEIQDYYRTMGSDYYEPDVVKGTATILQGGDTLMVVSYDKTGTINEIEVLSSLFQLNNGIRIGLSSDEMASKYNADFLTTDDFAGESWQSYNVRGLSKNITLLTQKNHEGNYNWYWSVVGSQEPDRSKYKCVKDNIDGNPSVYIVPSELTKGCRLEKIVVMENGYDFLHIQ